MTIATPAHAFGLEQQGDILVLGTIWRGAMIGMYSSTDAAIIQCLEQASDAGLALPQGAFDDCPQKRLLALEGLVSDRTGWHTDGGENDAQANNAATIKALSIWRQMSAMRGPVMNGRFSAKGRRLKMEWSQFRNGVREHCGPLTCSPLDLFEQLVSLKRASEGLETELVKIRRDMARGEPA